MQEMGFEPNSYDLYVANKMINRKQCTIVRYVDDNKISHEDPNVVTDIINRIETKFDAMTVRRGTEHEFMGTNIPFVIGIIETHQYLLC
jgi:hypothetical protein